MTMVDDSTLLETMHALSNAAGVKAMEIYNSEFAVVEKNDKSPVTEADKLGEEIIVAGLRLAAPSIPILAEEAASDGNIPTLGSTFFLVDPLDGTREFVNRTGEFTVNIALIRDNKPVLGIVYAPAIGKLYGGGPDGAYMETFSAPGTCNDRTEIKARTAQGNGLTAVASRSHRSPETDAFLETLTIAEFAAAGSSLKFCLIAEGAADVYPRLGRTMEWDTGAGQAVLEAAGGSVDVFGEEKPLEYNKIDRGYDNPHFIAWGKR